MKRKINIAVIGCSGMAEGHMYGVTDNGDRAHLYGICDIDPERLALRQERFNPERAVSDYRDLVNDPNVDAAVIVTPDQLHLEMTVAFLQAGKDVLCEKPMALTVSECEEMMRVEKETGRKGILEIKTTNILQSMQKEKWKERIPDNYYIQVLHYLMVTEYEFVVLVAQLKSEFNDEIYKQTKHYKIERADVEEDIQYLAEEERKFWEKVKEKKMPNLLLPEI